MKLNRFIAGFFRTAAAESMTRLISLIVALSGVVYMIFTWDYIGTIAIFTTSGVIKVGGNRIGKQKES
jgi:hypothetical protein|tara:strand:+ start:28 stop:231 length:204 start_codon:yes stop_codon:yes gene_type:complete